MTMDFSIQTAIASDVSALVELEKKVFVKSDGLLTRRSFNYHLNSKNLLIVAKNTKKIEGIMGYILVFIHKLSARIHSLAVDPAFQGNGIASALLKYSFNVLRSRNINRVTLELRQSNFRALKLYQSFGFKMQSYYYNYYGDHENAISMIWTASSDISHTYQITKNSGIIVGAQSIKKNN